METFFVNIDWSEIARATIDTLLMLGGAMALTVVFGIPLGVLLYLSGKGRLAANPVLNGLLSSWSMCCGRCPSSSC